MASNTPSLSQFDTMPKSEILIIEDDRKTADLIRLYLKREGYSVRLAHDGTRGLALAEQASPAAIVLDLMLPGMDGLDICHALRAAQEGAGVPILMLTARSTEDDLILGLETGADDYLTKPFSPRELVARLTALLRRSGGEHGNPDVIEAGDLTIDFFARQLRLRGEPVRLTPAQFRLLGVLIERPGRAFSRQELLDRVFGFTYDGQPRTIDVHILKLRKKIEEDPSNPRYIQTVYGFGYKFSDQLSAVSDQRSDEL
jgi:DNA-binding response OmpR family regulator